MKLGSGADQTQEQESDLLNDIISEVREREQEQESGSRLEDVLDAAAAEASQVDDASEQAPLNDMPINERSMRFMATYKVRKEDVGMTPMQVYLDQENPNRAPSVDEEEILDALLFRGHYTRQFGLGARYDFVLSTVNARAEQIVRRILQETVKSDEEAFAVTFNAMLVARNLASINGRPTCSAIPGQEDFNTEKVIRERLDFVLSLPVEVMDAIGVRVNEFTRAISMATQRSLSDF